MRAAARDAATLALTGLHPLWSLFRSAFATGDAARFTLVALAMTVITFLQGCALAIPALNHGWLICQDGGPNGPRGSHERVKVWKGFLALVIFGFFTSLPGLMAAYDFRVGHRPRECPDKPAHPSTVAPKFWILRPAIRSMIRGTLRASFVDLVFEDWGFPI